MRALLTCRACSTRWQLNDEPTLLTQLICPNCAAQPDAVAAEEFASALEDALAQLWRLHQHMTVEVQLHSAAIPTPFCPQSASDS